MTRISGWGRFPRIDCDVVAMRDPGDARNAIRTRRSIIGRGNGRSYGDAALNRDGVLSSLRSSRIRAFDPLAATVTCEAGLMLADLLTFLLPRGFFPPVTPGTKYVTVGGMVAADVHGKNHHQSGSFGRHVTQIDLMTAAGEIVVCTPSRNAELFAATCGGMGLTGIILAVTFRLVAVQTSQIRQETLIAADIDQAMVLCEQSAGWTYTVAWVDCLARGASLGRSIIYRGEHATVQEAPGATLAAPDRAARRVPFDVTPLALNRLTMRAANELYFRRGRAGTAFLSYDQYFYPLDGLLDWNRLYGRQGFTQYQCVIPREAGREGVHAVLARVAAHGAGSLLAVLKLLGAEGDGLMSFPLEGYTLALDFPATSSTFNLLLELDAIVTDHGGRIYLAKDARTGAAMLPCGYRRLDQFRSVRARVDPGRKFQSLLSQRLDL